MIEVRRIRADEWEQLKAVRLAALTDSPSAFGSTHEREVAFPDAEWQDRAQRGNEGVDRVTFVAVEGHGERFVGIVGGFEAPDHVDLVSMWTAPAARRTGVGRRLIKAVVDWAGDRPVELWVTRGNRPAHALYLAMGFLDTDDVQAHPNDPCAEEQRMVRRAG